MQVKDALEKYGLSDREADIFLHLLGNGDQTAFAAAKALGLPKTTVYNTLEALKKRGLVSSWKKNGVAHYGAESPKRLISETEAKIELISTVMPQLLAASKQSMSQVVTRQYEGVDGFRVVYEDMLDSMERAQETQLYAVSNPNMLTYVPRFFPKWLERRMQLGIYTHLIATSQSSSELPHIYASNELRETRLAPESITFNSTIDIYGDNVALFSFESDEPATTIVIESKAVAAIFRQFFDVLWNVSRKT
jgi:sugar-specific transcriptional regulator TrmB